MFRTQRLLHGALPYALLAALAPLAMVSGSSDAEACDGCTGHAEAQAPIESTQLLVVKFHADWCGSCVKLSPSLESLQANFAGQPVDFVRLDLTSDATRAAAQAQVARLGLEKIFEDYGNKTGFALIIDAASGQVLGEIRASQELDAMQALVTQSLDKAKA